MQSDAEGSSFFNFLNVVACDWVEFLEECGSDEGDNAGILSVVELQMAAKPSMGVHAASFPRWSAFLEGR